MNFNQIISIITGQALLPLFFKSFAILLSFLYLIYSLVVVRQTKLMVNTLVVRARTVLLLVSHAQVLAAFILVLLAIFVL